jgi:hypothetical protein
MNTPPYNQLTGLGEFCKAQLRADEYLTSAAPGPAATADEICKQFVPFQLFAMVGDAVGFFDGIHRQNLPVLAIWVKSSKDTIVRGEFGLEVDLGIQYLYPSRASDTTKGLREARANLWAVAVWWQLRGYLRINLNPTLRSSHHIWNSYPVAMDIMPPTSEPVRGFTASAVMTHKWEPWRTASDAVLLERTGAHRRRLQRERADGR